MKSKYVGKWRITEMELWDRDYIDLVVPGHITFKKSGQGSMQFGAADCDLDCRVEHVGEMELLQFSFIGEDEGDSVVGRGWARLDNERVEGRIVFHFGDESGFVAEKGEFGRRKGSVQSRDMAKKGGGNSLAD